MKCEVVKDLMPLYVDELCSEETTGEIREHIKECELCRKKMQELEMPIEDITPEEEISIEPMKKVNRKLHTKNIWIGGISLLAVIIIGSISFLSYNQINRSGISFERIYEYFHFQQIGKSFANGNLEPLLQCLAIPGEDSKYATYAQAAYNGDLDAYVQDAKDDIREQYTNVFEGKELKLKEVMTEYIQGDDFDFEQSKHLMIGLVYEVDNVKYGLRLERSTGNKFYITDGFATSFENDYVETETDTEVNASITEKTEEAVDETNLLEHRESLFRCLQPYSDEEFFLIKNLVRHFYNQSTSGNKDAVVLNSFTNYFIKEEDINANAKEEYSNQVNEQFKELATMGYRCSDVDFILKGYDKEKHMYRYQVIYTFTYETKDCYLMMDCYRNSNIMQEYLILNPENVQVFGDDIPEKMKEKIVDVWE